MRLAKALGIIAAGIAVTAGGLVLAGELGNLANPVGSLVAMGTTMGVGILLTQDGLRRY